MLVRSRLVVTRGFKTRRLLLPSSYPALYSVAQAQRVECKITESTKST
jgi:hypothetical protein